MTSKNLALLLLQTATQYPSKKAVFQKINKKFESITWAQTLSRVESLASFFVEKGIKSGDRIAILSENRPEWLITDFAALTVGAVTVPIYPTLSVTEIEYLLKDAGCRWIAVSSKDLLAKICPIQKKLPSLEGILVFDGGALVGQSDFYLPFFLIRDAWNKQPVKELNQLRQNIASDAIASIIYTSGTTGVPKGVMLTHENFMQNVFLCRETLKMGSADAHLSFLPLCHVFERMAGHFLMVYIGATITYAESLETVPADILEIKPTFLLGVPRFFEKIQARVLGQVQKASSFRRHLFEWTRKLGAAKRAKRQNFLDVLLSSLAAVLVCRTFKKRLGGNLRFCVSGGAPLSKEIAEFFCDLGVMIYEGYGLTETAPVISVNREEKWRFGSVGIPLHEVEVKITPDGEIVTKSACVMKGYFQKPEDTAEVLKDGWFYTGDLGCIDKEGFLFITGRKKELIATSGGKKISPKPIEELIEKDPYILRCVLFGEGKKFITALIVPKQSELIEYATQKKIDFKTYSDLIKNRAILNMLTEHMDCLMENLASYERVKYFALLETDFSQNSGELTPTLKVKRDVVCERYKHLLLPFYDIER